MYKAYDQIIPAVAIFHLKSIQIDMYNVHFHFFIMTECKLSYLSIKIILLHSALCLNKWYEVHCSVLTWGEVTKVQTTLLKTDISSLLAAGITINVGLLLLWWSWMHKHVFQLVLHVMYKFILYIYILYKMRQWNEYCYILSLIMRKMIVD